MNFRGARLPAFGAPPAGGCPRRMAGRWNGIMIAPPRGEAAGRGVLIFSRIRPAIRPARFARRGGATGSASGRRSALAETRFLTALQQPLFYACCNAWPQPPGCPLKCGLGLPVFV